jgi:peptidoglycan hydrolase-like protein with peptidoglycan-binding domain
MAPTDTFKDRNAAALQPEPIHRQSSLDQSLASKSSIHSSFPTQGIDNFEQPLKSAASRLEQDLSHAFNDLKQNLPQSLERVGQQVAQWLHLDGSSVAGATRKLVRNAIGEAKSNLSETTKASHQPFIGIIDTGFGAGEHGQQMLEAISSRNNQAPKWLAQGVGNNQWADSLVQFTDAAKAGGHKQAIANLSFDLTQVNKDGSVTTRTELTEAEHNALAYAHKNGVLVVASAGNQGEEMSALGKASQEFSNIIAVGATEGQDKAAYSSYGKGLDIMAPGNQPGLAGKGTSLSAAEATGAISKVWFANPDLSARQVIQSVESTAKDLNKPGWDDRTGFGALNTEGAIARAKQTAPESIFSRATDQVHMGTGGGIWKSNNGAIASERSNNIVAAIAGLGKKGGLIAKETGFDIAKALPSETSLKYQPGVSPRYDDKTKIWQQQMKNLGYQIDVDGKFGAQSAQVARKFQKANGLAADGIVGQDTWKASFGKKENRLGGSSKLQPSSSGEVLKYQPGAPMKTGESVKQWQQRMENLGYNINVDGKFGPQSAQVARRFQKDKGLTVDGVVGRDTWSTAFGRSIGSSMSKQNGGISQKTLSFKRFEAGAYPEVKDATGWTRHIPKPGGSNNSASATNGFEVMQASLSNKQVVRLEGQLLAKIKADPDMHKKENEIVNKVKNDSRYGKEAFQITGEKAVGFGGDRWTSPNEDWGVIDDHNPLRHRETYGVAGNELTWVLRNATVRYWAEADSQGKVNIQYRLHDQLDLSPHKGRSRAYNNISTVTGLGYHTLAGGNKNLQTRAEWSTTA